jgi:hypothetical protein
MLQMRNILAEFGSTGLFRMSDQMVLAQIARLLISGRVHLHQTNYPTGHPEIPAEGASIKPTKSAPFPRSGQRFAAVVPFREPPVDSPTFLADIDFQVQAETMMAAARSGKPFCPE